MNTVLVIMALLNTAYWPEFVITFQTEAECMHKRADYHVFPGSTRTAVCIPPDGYTIENGEIILKDKTLYLPPPNKRA